MSGGPKSEIAAGPGGQGQGQGQRGPGGARRVRARPRCGQCGWWPESAVDPPVRCGAGRGEPWWRSRAGIGTRWDGSALISGPMPREGRDLRRGRLAQRGSPRAAEPQWRTCGRRTVTGGPVAGRAVADGPVAGRAVVERPWPKAVGAGCGRRLCSKDVGEGTVGLSGNCPRGACCRRRGGGSGWPRPRRGPGRRRG